MIVGILESLESHIKGVITEVMPGENVRYLFDFQTMQTNQGNLPVIVVILEADSSIIGQKLLVVRPLPLQLTNDVNALKSMVRDAYEDIEKQRSALLEDTVETNGKLILP